MKRREPPGVPGWLAYAAHAAWWFGSGVLLASIVWRLCG